MCILAYTYVLCVICSSQYQPYIHLIAAISALTIERQDPNALGLTCSSSTSIPRTSSDNRQAKKMPVREGNRYAID